MYTCNVYIYRDCKSIHANQQQQQHLEFQPAKVLSVVRNSREARRSFLTPAMIGGELWIGVFAYMAKQRVLGNEYQIITNYTSDVYIYMYIHMYIYIFVQLHDSDTLPVGHPTSKPSKVLTVLFRLFSEPRGLQQAEYSKNRNTLIFHCRNLPSSNKCHWSAAAANSLDHQ